MTIRATQQNESLVQPRKTADVKAQRCHRQHPTFFAAHCGISYTGFPGSSNPSTDAGSSNKAPGTKLVYSNVKMTMTCWPAGDNSENVLCTRHSAIIHSLLNSSDQSSSSKNKENERTALINGRTQSLQSPVGNNHSP